MGLVAAVQAVEYLPYVSTKLASDGRLHSLRSRHDINDHPTSLAIPLNYIHSPKQAILDQVKKNKCSHLKHYVIIIYPYLACSKIKPRV